MEKQVELLCSSFLTWVSGVAGVGVKSNTGRNAGFERRRMDASENASGENMKKSFATKVLLKLPVIGYRLKQAHFNLLTQTGEELLAENEEAWQDYPRPQMRRPKYRILNGTWRLNGRDIRMPFPPQAILSAYEEKVGEYLSYEKMFELPTEFMKGRVLLHFGAVDQIAEVYVNDVMVGKHEGGYLPFSFDVTEAVKEGENLLVVKATDTLSEDYPYGKQRKKRGGMWYTPVSGIWQTVWMEH